MEKKVSKCWSNVAKFDVQDKRKNANNLVFKSLAFLSVVSPGVNLTLTNRPIYPQMCIKNDFETLDYVLFLVIP